MVLLSARKRMMLHELELVIRRCPVCLTDTEQDAFYTKNPDFSAEAMTPTTPQFRVNFTAPQENKLNWYIVARCRKCGFLYKVTAIPQYKMKEVKRGTEEDVNLALFCCDICYNEEAKYENAEIFIRLSEGKNVYLCEKHAGEVEKEKRGSYAALIDRFNVWKINDAMPKAVRLRDGRVIALIGDRGYMEQILVELKKKGELSVSDLVGALREKSLVHKTPSLMESQINALEKLSLVAERQTGRVFRTRQVSLTGLGVMVAEALG